MKKHEYYYALNKKLEGIKEKHGDLVATLDCKKEFKNLFTVFLAELKEAGVSDSIYETLKQALIEKSNVERTQEEHECLFGASQEDREAYTFGEMISKCNEKDGPQLLEEAAEYAINKAKSNAEKGNVLDDFLTYVIAKKYDDIEHGEWKEAKYALKYYESTLYGYPLGRMILEKGYFQDKSQYYSPESLHIRHNAQGLKIGAFLLQSLMKDMNEEHPGEQLASPTVMMSNVNALKMYTRLGAEVYADGEKVEDPINGMDHSRKDNCWVVFPPESIKENAERVIERPTQRINQILNYKEASREEVDEEREQ